MVTASGTMLIPRHVIVHASTPIITGAMQADRKGAGTITRTTATMPAVATMRITATGHTTRSMATTRTMVTTRTTAIGRIMVTTRTTAIRRIMATTRTTAITPDLRIITRGGRTTMLGRQNMRAVARTGDQATKPDHRITPDRTTMPIGMVMPATTT
jgi:hypothetical protein